MANWSRDAIGESSRRTRWPVALGRARWRYFAERFPAISEMRVIDLGGTPASWRLAPVMPMELTIINLSPLTSDEEQVNTVQADACDLPAVFAARVST